MDGEEAEIEAVERRRRPLKRLVALGLLGIVLLAAFILWTQRMPIASDYIDRELARRGVRATYQVKQIGLHTQRLENLVIGDPRAPDLTARWVEVRLAWHWFSPKVTLITARGVRLHARLEGGRIRMGEVDKLLPPPTGAPFRFPDQVVDVADASIRLDTPNGRIGIALNGKGRLSDGFRGGMAARSAMIDVGSCRIARPAALFVVAIDKAKPAFKGPLEAASLSCGNSLAIAAPHFLLDAALGETLKSWKGKAAVKAGAARISGNAAQSLAGNFSFDGNSAMTRGALDLASVGARFSGLTAARAGLEGRYALSLDSGKLSLLAEAGATGASASAAASGFADALASAGGTPIEPVGNALSAAVRRAAAGFDVMGSLRLVNDKTGGAVRFDRLRLASRSGARLALGGGEGVTYYWPNGGARVDGDFALSGGGFPAIRLSLDQAGAGKPIRGVGRIAPMTVGASRLALGDIRFDAAPGGATRIATVATIDGPLSDGRVEGLVLPISGRLDGRGGFAFGESCVASRFQALRMGALRLGPTSLPLCPSGRALVWKAPGGAVQGGAAIRAPRLAGTLGASPFSLASSRILFGFDGPSFTASDMAIRLGRPDSVSTLAIAQLTGRFSGPGVSGRYSGLGGKLANVPLVMSEGAGAWSLRGGDLAMAGPVRIADAVEPSRFYPLISNDFALTLADNRIAANGWLTDPETGTRIARTDIAHNLSNGAGRALLDVPGITFGPDYQPEQLTRLTTGVVALVNGVLKGEGEIRWDSQGSSSTGTFSTQNMDLAATFGPVRGLSTTLHFTDLLGLVTAPGQVADIGLLQTGIDVLDGRIRYQLLGDLRLKVEGGRWPYAGGELILEETILDFSKPTAKRLTFRVVGLDAAAFIQQMEFSNISATGTFDGVIPMVFDERGGRIVGGRLIARQGGGTLSYIGELTDKELGVYGKLAFDALKALRYNKLTIALDGALDGEFVAGIELDGIARDPSLGAVGAGGGIQGLVARRALGQLAKIPFEFNITVRGPFRTLLATARSLEDPTDLIQSALPEKLRAKPDVPVLPDTPLVQPQESETMR